MKPVISIICNTYNQKKYISQALDSFLMQKVSVPFEILVHDDASTDGTSDIVREYADKYPDIVKPLIQTENQYSKEGLITYRYQIPRAEGKYLAFCEGDDYWTDPEKLQIQYDYLESHPEYSACCHAYDMVNCDRTLIERRNDADDDTDFPLPKFLNNQLEVPQLATFLARKTVFDGFSGVFYGIKANDMVFRIMCALNGKVHYFNRSMSAYRRFVEGSWTVRMGNNVAAISKQLEAFIPVLERLDEETDHVYHKEIAEAIDIRRYKAAWLRNDYKTARKCDTFLNQKISKRIIIGIGCLFPKFVNKLRKS